MDTPSPEAEPKPKEHYADLLPQIPRVAVESGLCCLVRPAFAAFLVALLVLAAVHWRHRPDRPASLQSL